MKTLTEHATQVFANVPEDIMPLVPTFLFRKELELAELRAHLVMNDFSYVRMIGHRYKGTGASYGIQEISDYGAQLETLALAKNRTELETTIEELGQFINLLKRELILS